MRAVEKRNPVIRSFLGSDAGIDLMAIDSRMALDVVKGCAKLSIPVLPVHDSFVAPASQGSRVEGNNGRNPCRTVNKLSYSNPQRTGDFSPHMEGPRPPPVPVCGARSPVPRVSPPVPGEATRGPSLRRWEVWLPGDRLPPFCVLLSCLTPCGQTSFCVYPRRCSCGNRAGEL